MRKRTYGLAMRRVFSFFSVSMCLLALSVEPSWATDAPFATNYFPVLPYDATPDAEPQLVPVAVNRPFTGDQRGVTRVIIAIHDGNRDANATLSMLSSLAGASNSSVLIIAPQFLLPSDLNRFAKALPKEEEHIFATWDFLGWEKGDDASAFHARNGVSSFTVVDLLLMYVSDHNAFPDVQSVIITGFGAGANFVHRYAAFGRAADTVASQNIDIRYLVANASSYLYQTANRPLGGRKGFGRPDAAACPDYDAYPFGLQKLNPYTRHVGPNAAKTDFIGRPVVYLSSPMPDLIPESDCGAIMQGASNSARAVNYQAYIDSVYGDVGARTQIFSAVADAKNDVVGLYGSACGMAVLFGNGSCVHTFGGTQ